MSTPFADDGRRDPAGRLAPFEDHDRHEPGERLAGPPVALIDLLDRLLTGGAVLTGDLVLSIADVDLVHINLRAVIRSITAEDPAPWAVGVTGPGRAGEEGA